MSRQSSVTILNLLAAFCWAAGAAGLVYQGWVIQSPGLFVTGIVGLLMLMFHFFTEVLD